MLNTTQTIKAQSTILRLSALFDYAKALGLKVDHLDVSEAITLLHAVEKEMGKVLHEINFEKTNGK
jgi:hypothetical protein